MKLFLVQRDPEKIGWDEYEGFVAAAETSEAALSFHPTADEGPKAWDVSLVTITEIGKANPEIKAGCLFTAFHAG